MNERSSFSGGFDNLFSVFFLTVHAAVGLGLLISQMEDVRQFLFDGGDTARVLASDHVGDLLRQLQRFLLHNLIVTDDIDGDIVVDVAKYIQINIADRSLYFDDVLASHLVAAGVLDDRHLTFGQMVQAKMIVDIKALAGLNVVQNNPFL